MKLPFNFGKKEKVKPVKGGQTERRKCPKCGKTTDFREVTVTSKWTAYHVVKLWDSEKTAFMCTACDEVMELSDTEDAELSAKEIALRKKLKDKEERVAAKQAELDRKQREAAAERQEDAIDDELAEMKKKLGID